MSIFMQKNKRFLALVKVGYVFEQFLVQYLFPIYVWHFSVISRSSFYKQHCLVIVWFVLKHHSTLAACEKRSFLSLSQLLFLIRRFTRRDILTLTVYPERAASEPLVAKLALEALLLTAHCNEKNCLDIPCFLINSFRKKSKFRFCPHSIKTATAALYSREKKYILNICQFCLNCTEILNL